MITEADLKEAIEALDAIEAIVPEETLTVEHHVRATCQVLGINVMFFDPPTTLVVFLNCGLNSWLKSKRDGSPVSGRGYDSWDEALQALLHIPSQ